MTSTRQSFDSAVDQRLERAAVERVRGRVERHGDAGLRRRHEVDREAVLLEDGERIGEEADLVPHAERLEREQRDALLDADGLHARAAVAARCGDDRAFELGLLRGVHGQRNRVLLHRQDAARVQDLGAAARDLLRFVVVERLEQARVRHGLGIRREHAGHVGPDLEPPRAELRREIAARRVGATAAEQHGVAVRVARDETLRDQHACRPTPAAAGTRCRVRSCTWRKGSSRARWRRAALRRAAACAHRATARRCLRRCRKAAPMRVAINSPFAITRARRRSLISPIRWMPSALRRRSVK